MSRIDKIQEELRKLVSIIVQQELRDPRIGFVTIASVEITADLRDAKIYFTIMDTEKPPEETVMCLERSAGYVRKLIGQRMSIKFTPQLRFIYDDSMDKQKKIDDIIDKIHKEKDSQ